MPSPLHRDPDQDGDDYGCFTKRDNHRVACVVAKTKLAIIAGVLTDGTEVVDFVRARLEKIPNACDTIVKENVFYALDATLAEAEIELADFAIYGW